MYKIYCKLRDAKGYKDADINRLTGVSKPTLSDWKRGVSIPKQDKLMKIADCLGVSLDYLMTGEEHKADLSEETAKLVGKLVQDPEMAKALKKYFELSDEKKKHVIDTINMLSDV